MTTFTFWQLLLGCVLSSLISAVITGRLWHRQYDRLADAWAQDHLRLDDMLEEFEEGGPICEIYEPTDPASLFEYIREHDDLSFGYHVESETSCGGGVRFVVSLKEGGADDAEADP